MFRVVLLLIGLWYDQVNNNILLVDSQKIKRQAKFDDIKVILRCHRGSFCTLSLSCYQAKIVVLSS